MQGAWQLGFHLAGTLLCGSLSLYFAYRALRRLFSAKARKRDEPLEIQARRSGSSLSMGFVFTLAFVVCLLLTFLFMCVPM